MVSNQVTQGTGSDSLARLKRLLKYWSKSRVEAEGPDGKERVRRIPFSGLQRASDAARRLFCLAPEGLRQFLALACVARLAEIAADIGAALAPWPAPKSNSNAAHSGISTVS
jgi:hypothetical protein